MKPEELVLDTKLAAFGAKGKFWQNVGVSKIEPLFTEVLHVDPEDDEGLSPVNAVQQSEVVFLSVPDEQIEHIIHEIASELRGKIVLANLSTWDVELFQSVRAHGAEVCLLHTLVSTVSPHEHQSIAVAPFDALCQNAKMIGERIASALEMHAQEMRPEEHVHKISERQSEAHLTARLFALMAAERLERHNFSPGELNACTTTSQQLLHTAVDRILILDGMVSARFLANISEVIGKARSALDQIEAQLDQSPEALAQLFNTNAQR